MVAARINFQQGAKRHIKPLETKENSSKGNSSNKKAKEKGVYKGKNRLTPKELECYHKDNRCFKCGEQGHSYQTCPQRNARNEQPRASIIEAPKEDVHCKGSPLSYPWGRVREHYAFILFDPGSTHNFISLELATKLGIQEFEMGDAMKADGAFIGQDVSVTPLIGKLRIHIQGYVDKEDFFISPLKHEDVILGAPWFDRIATSIKFPERRIFFKFRKKDMHIVTQESSSTIPLVNDQAFDKSIKSSISTYMIFVKDSLSDVNKTQVNESGVHEDFDLSKFLNQFQDVFIDNIPRELPPKRGDDDHAIELFPVLFSVTGFGFDLANWFRISGLRQLDCIPDLWLDNLRTDSGSGLSLVHWTGLVTGQCRFWSLVGWFWLVSEQDWLLVSAGSGLWLVSSGQCMLVSGSGSDSGLVSRSVSCPGSGPSAGTQGSATQDPHIAASDSSSDFDVMEGYPMQQHPESSSQDMHALGQQPGISMFSRLKETLSRATRSEHATNEINEGSGEVDSPFTSQIDPVLSESVHVSTPATTPIGLSKLTPSETLLPDGRSLAEMQEVECYILAAREKEIESLRKAEQC
ncbi:hypothetical protein L7F22_010227 [Adiantum nelumboides]|nr:hypothetical protein [Adiantum nelumboides]